MSTTVQTLADVRPQFSAPLNNPHQFGTMTSYLSQGHMITTFKMAQREVDFVWTTGGATQVLGLSCDITDTNKVTETFTEITERLGPVRVLVNAAGIAQNQLLLKTSADDIRRYLDVNLVGAMVTCRAVLRGMVQRRQGCIINIGSIVGSKGNAGQCAYSASKAGLEGFTKSLAKEVAGRGITVNCVNPGFIRTDMTSGLPHIDQLQRQIPLGRLGKPEEVADLVWFLTHATYITGQSVFVDGGLQINS